MQISNDIRQALQQPASDELAAQVRTVLQEQNKVVVILDDDPTGTQTIHGLTVLTTWSDEQIGRELNTGSHAFFILTNSRSMPAAEADELAFALGTAIRRQAIATGKQVQVIYRGDSTLRGHYPNEMDALAAGLGTPQMSQLLLPAFVEGGRLTIDNVHYMLENNQLVPVAETPFARDFAFGFTHSNLVDYVVEKSKGTITPEEVGVINSNMDAPSLRQTLETHPVTIGNAVGYADLQAIAILLLQADTNCLVRSAASFVKAITGNPNKAALQQADLLAPGNHHGGLLVVGSYVSKTTAQLQQLLAQYPQLHRVELPVESVLAGDTDLEDMSQQLSAALKQGHDVVLYTSRNHVQPGKDAGAGLVAGNRVSAALCSLVRGLQVAPSFVVAKGGITSSDMATLGLGVQRAICIGQAMPGVPVWQLQQETKYPGMPFIIFPGNVGDSDALADLYAKLRGL